MRWLALLAVPLLLTLPPRVSAQPGSRPAITANAVAHGLKMTISIAHRSYPRNALVKVFVVVENVSDRPVRTALGMALCHGTNPFIEISDSLGRLAPQHPSIIYDNPGCRPPRGVAFPPHAKFRQTLLAVLGGSTVHAVLMGGAALGKRFVTVRAHVHLLPSSPPIATIHESDIGIYATVPKPAGARGLLYFAGSALCGTPQDRHGTVVDTVWSAGFAHRVYSGCSGPQDWHALAGYVNYPVAAIDYVRS